MKKLFRRILLNILGLKEYLIRYEYKNKEISVIVLTPYQAQIRNADIALDFSRQGLSAQEILKRTADAIKLCHLAIDGYISSKTNNISINVNLDDSTGKENIEKVSDTIKKHTIDVLTRESRPGGILSSIFCDKR